ncbi:unnamed protein product [Bursaphelenchus okinawaensis]|uniref:Uncharacterized protein n=1 Tax=Bursaphelenchus okinawaensis TaxID=465554 RepID=A0A811K303_9BILA|nr:unnamed protein product [Bursaphelenchus okinawaensis]CAG9089521.1 unnamed protein product [Bursaphelenchus okinawaensis]
MSTESVDSVGFQPPPNMAHHQGRGRLQGGGVTKIYNQPNFKDYKRKVDHRISFVIVLCLLTLTTLTCIYAFGSLKINNDLGHYVDRVFHMIKRQNRHRTCVKVQSEEGWVEECTNTTSHEQLEVEPSERTEESNEELDDVQEEALEESVERAKRQEAEVDDLFPTGSRVPPGAEIEPLIVDHQPDEPLTTLAPEVTESTSTEATTEDSTTESTTVAATESNTESTTVEATETSTESTSVAATESTTESTTIAELTSTIASESSTDSTVTSDSSSTTSGSTVVPIVIENAEGSTEVLNATLSGVFFGRDEGLEEATTTVEDQEWVFGFDNYTEADNVTHEPETFILPYDPRNLTEEELLAFADDIQHQHIVLWMLAALNLIVLILFAPFAFLFHKAYYNKSSFKVLYRVLLVVVLIFLLFEVYFLIEPLLRTAYNMPAQVDRVLLEGTPRPKSGLEDLEEAFACDFDYHPILVEFNKQDPCVPKIKNWLIPVMCVILMIVICLVPFFFLVFTWAWNACIKDAPGVKNARETVKHNIENRQLTREQMFNRALATSDSHSRTFSNSSNLPL